MIPLSLLKGNSEIHLKWSADIARDICAVLICRFSEPTSRPLGPFRRRFRAFIDNYPVARRKSLVFWVNRLASAHNTLRRLVFFANPR